MSPKVALLRANIEDELDWQRERLVALRFEPTLELLREQLTAFLAQLDDLA